MEFLIDKSAITGKWSDKPKLSFYEAIQARIAQLVAYQLGTGEVPGSNPGKGENYSLKISNWSYVHIICTENQFCKYNKFSFFIVKLSFVQLNSACQVYLLSTKLFTTIKTWTTGDLDLYVAPHRPTGALTIYTLPFLVQFCLLSGY